MMSPSSRNKEAAIFSIVLDSWTLLFESGSHVSGLVFIHFPGTNEEIAFEELSIYLNESLNLPQQTEPTRNLTSSVLDKQVLLSHSSETYDETVSILNQSNVVKISFKMHLSETLCASFNSKKIAVNHEIKAELRKLKLCGEYCDLSTIQPIEIRENYQPIEIRENYQAIEFHENVIINPLEKSGISSEFEEFVNEESTVNNLGHLRVKLNKKVYNFGDILSAKLCFESNKKLTKAHLSFRLLQILQLKNELQNSSCQQVLQKTRQTIFVPESGHFESRKSFPLIDPMVLSQPSVTRNDYFKVYYVFVVSLEMQNLEISTELLLHVERQKSYLCDLKRVYSDDDIPLQSLILTVSDLKTDGLQSYIPLKNSYENNRLMIKKGNPENINALLTIVTNSCQPYENDSVIKGYVYLQLADKFNREIEFENLFLILVGVRKYENLDPNIEGEIFLFKRINLKGAKRNKKLCENVKLEKNFGFMISEFELDLRTIDRYLPPTFESDNYRVCYELKADVFKLRIDKNICSLYTTLPIVIKETVAPNLPKDVQLSLKTDDSNIGRYLISGREITVSCTTDRQFYYHRDAIRVNLNIKNQTKYQIILKLELNQLSRFSQLNNNVKKRCVYNPIIILSLPKSRLVTTENIVLVDKLFHRQPTAEFCKEFEVKYHLSITVSIHATRKTIGEVVLPIKIHRKYGHVYKRISRDGCPLLPLTLEVYGKGKLRQIPDFLTSYYHRHLLKLTHSDSITSQWSKWNIDALTLCT